MAFPTQILGPDGTLRDDLAFSTTNARRFFSGVLPLDAVDFQVSFNGSGFSSDPSLALWSNGSWVAPNPQYEQDGFVLRSGANTIQVRAVYPSGVATPAATAVVNLVSNREVVLASAPTNVRVTQKNATVLLEAEPSASYGFRGMNFYAATESGGGATGYTRVNLELVSTGTGQQETQDFGELNLDVSVAVDGAGDHLADPQYFRLIGRQENTNGDLLQSDLDTRYVIPETANSLRLTGTLASVRTFTVYSFEHGRTNGPLSTPPTVRVGAFSALQAEKPLYYVAAAQYYDPNTNTEYTSSFSEELVAKPLSITTAVGSFPTVTRQSIVESYITAVFRSNPQIKVDPGSVLRDTVIDPYSSEAERLRFILDFLNRGRSPTLLLQIDDPQGSGSSIAVAQSTYKQALKAAFFLDTDAATQAVIDASFDSYASNFGVLRRSGQYAQGEVTFFTVRKPSYTIQIPLGTLVTGGSVQFSTTRAASIDFTRLASYYDPVTGRYRVNVPVRAVTPGSRGNIGAGQIRQVAASLSSLQVTNSAPMFGGSEVESNLRLIERARNRLASVDSGTVQGYTQTAADVPGVIKANVVSAGDPLMMRDLDESGVHRGGKVDIWVQGESNIATITDTFAFSYELAQDVQFEVYGDPTNLKFSAVDPTLSTSNPIIEMLDYPSAGYELKNITTGQVFNLSGVTITSYNTIQLDTSVLQPVVSLTDVVLGSYRKQAGNKFVLPRQPVSAIQSVVGAVAGTLAVTDYGLYHPNSPLGYGRSTEAGDYLEITAGASGDLISVVNETHVLIGQYPEYLDNLGVNFLTINVYNEYKTILYKGPDDPSGNPDYTISLGDQTTAVSITRVETGAIPSGSTIVVDYSHDENFTVTYTTNLIVSLTQNAVDVMKHATADVLAKEAIPVPLDISATVVLQRGLDPVTVDQVIRTNLANFFSSLRLGDAVRQSDIISVLEGSTGVSYVVVPMSKLVRGADSIVTYEAISTDTAAESTAITAYSTNLATVYLLVNPLSAATTDGGGPEGAFKAVYQNEAPLSLLDASQPFEVLGLSAGRAYIIGGSGAVIPGLTDFATLYADGYVTPESQEAELLARTANKVMVSLSVGQNPTTYQYACTYIVGADSGAKDIDPGATEYGVQGELTLTYDEDR
jgi:hypothetical protein